MHPIRWRVCAWLLESARGLIGQSGQALTLRRKLPVDLVFALEERAHSGLS
jgi:hypothetical protein